MPNIAGGVNMNAFSLGAAAIKYFPSVLEGLDHVIGIKNWLASSGRLRDDIVDGEFMHTSIRNASRMMC